METAESTRIHELEAKVAQLTDLVQRLAAPAAATSGPDAEAGNDAGTSRRRMFKLAGAAALGAVGASAVSALPAAADNGVSLLGAANATTAITRVNYTGTSANETSFVFGSGSWTGNGSFHPAALGGWSDGTANRPVNGIYGYTSAASGCGVVGRANHASATGDGVYGYAPASTGVHGEGVTGVLAEGVNIGVSASGSSPTSWGVWAIGGAAGAVGMSTAGYAVNASVSGKANLYLQPNNNFLGSTPKVPVRNRTDEHQAGELESIDGELWFCVTTGTPGTWKKLTGPTVAGGFHAIAPTRVYDSRVPAPSQGVLGSGGHKTISVKDGRDLTTGAVTAADLIPAGATAVTANVTVVNTASSGFLAINPGGSAVVKAATVNWFGSNQILNNGVNLTLNANREVEVICGGDTTAQTDYVIDVTGYFL